MAADGEKVGMGTGEWVAAGAGVASGERGLWLAGAVAADGGEALELSSSCTEREREREMDTCIGRVLEYNEWSSLSVRTFS
jgi:hypothetical protein